MHPHLKVGHNDIISANGPNFLGLQIGPVPVAGLFFPPLRFTRLFIEGYRVFSLFCVWELHMLGGCQFVETDYRLAMMDPLVWVCT